MSHRDEAPIRWHLVALFVAGTLLPAGANADDFTVTPAATATRTMTPTPTASCAPTGTPYCSDNCVPCPTIRPECYASACGWCIQNPTCASNEGCVPSYNPNIAGCCACATVTPTPTLTPTPTASCAPTGTPYCSDNCVPCPTIRPGCYVSACGWCIANPVCTSNEACVPSYNPDINGCCSCATVTPTPSGIGTPTVTPTAISCTGDCSDDSQVTVAEILMMVDIALGNADIATCRAGDANDDQQITVDEILSAVNNALEGCPPPGTPTEMPTESSTESPSQTPTPTFTATPTPPPTPTRPCTSPTPCSPGYFQSCSGTPATTCNCNCQACAVTCPPGDSTYCTGVSLQPNYCMSTCNCVSPTPTVTPTPSPATTSSASSG